MKSPFAYKAEQFGECSKVHASVPMEFNRIITQHWEQRSKLADLLSRTMDDMYGPPSFPHANYGENVHGIDEHLQ